MQAKSLGQQGQKMSTRWAFLSGETNSNGTAFAFIWFESQWWHVVTTFLDLRLTSIDIS
jgi:hypothetical protein